MLPVCRVEPAGKVPRMIPFSGQTIPKSAVLVAQLLPLYLMVCALLLKLSRSVCTCASNALIVLLSSID